MTELIKPASVKELLNLMNSKIPAGYVEVSADKLNNIEGLSDPRIDYKAYYNAQTHDVILTGTNKPQPLGDKADAGIFYTDARNTADGSFVDKTPVAATQTELVAKYLINDVYKDATITLFGQGQVGLAVSIASYDLRNDIDVKNRVAATLTYDSWKGLWTDDGRPDAGVLDLRSGGRVSDDPSYFYKSWNSGGTVANLDTGNWTDASKIVIKPVVGKVYDGVTEAVSWLADKVPVPGWMPDLGWMADTMMGAAKENVVDAITGAATAWVDSNSSMNSLAWLPENMPVAVASDVLSGKVSIGQWNVQQGRSASGYEINSTNYANTGAKYTTATGTSQQAVTQITTFKDPATGAVLEARVQGTMVNGQFQATPGSVYVQGLTTDGKVVIPGVTDNRTEYAETIGAGRGVVNPPPAIANTPRNSFQYVVRGDVHAVMLTKGGTLSDVWAMQKNSPNGFSNEEDFYLAVMQANPEIRNKNLVPTGATLYLPQKMADGSITYHYANQTSINSNPANGEYHMVVPDGQGGQVVYSRKFLGDVDGVDGKLQAQYEINQTHIDKSGAEVFSFNGHQVGRDGELIPASAVWQNAQQDGASAFDDDVRTDLVTDKATGKQTLTVTDEETGKSRSQDVATAPAGKSPEQRAADAQNAMYSDMAGFVNALRGKDKVNQLLYAAKIGINYQISQGNTQLALGAQVIKGLVSCANDNSWRKTA